VRDISPDYSVGGGGGNPFWPKSVPLYAPAIVTPDIRCGRDAWMKEPNGTARVTQTADVVAGTEVGFRLGRIAGVSGTSVEYPQDSVKRTTNA
jgi:hypothetical protein